MESLPEPPGRQHQPPPEPPLQAVGPPFEWGPSLLGERRRRRYLPLEAYQELGRQARTGLQQAMAVVADAAVDTLRPDEQAMARLADPRDIGDPRMVQPAAMVGE